MTLTNNHEFPMKLTIIVKRSNFLHFLCCVEKLVENLVHEHWTRFSSEK